MFGSFFNAVFFFKDFVHPAVAVALIAFILTVLTTLAYKLLTNQEKMKTMKEEQKMLQAEIKEQMKQKNHEKMMELQKLAMEKNLAYMKHSMWPMLITLVPLLIIFGWIRTTFGAADGPNPALFHLPVLGWGLSWLWVYIIISVITSMIIRKVFKIY